MPRASKGVGKWRSKKTGKYVSAYYAKRHPASVYEVKGGENKMVTAKFVVTKHSKWSDDRTGEVELTPDYAQGRNADWAKATPSGVIRMTITVPEVFDRFAIGQAFTVKFEENNE